MIFGGDGFYTAIDPDNSNRIIEEYAYGRMSESVDGGHTWISKYPDWGNSSSTALFSAPLQLDPGNADHLMAGGQQISQTAVPYTYRCYPDPTLEPTGCPLVYVDWVDVFDLGTVPGTSVARKATAVDLRGDAGYAAACGPCSVFTKVTGFESAIVTNVGGAAPPQFGAEDGWHEAAASGLPDRYVTSVRIDPSDATNRTIYVTLGGYSSHWVPPGANGEDISRVGSGHVFVSHDAGETFTDVSADLPDAPANWVLVRAGRLIVGTDIGVFISTNASGGAYSRLGDLPSVPVVAIREDPANPNRIVAATFGRGVYQYVFG
jgi:hypothetical protein